MNKKLVSNTGLLTAMSRSKLEELSQDPYAKFWVSEIDIPYDEYISGSPKWETELICLRNRFFLEEGRLFFKSGSGIIVLLGAGYSSLSYLMPEKVIGIELDYDKKQIDRKVKIEKELYKKGLISSLKKVSHFTYDLSKSLPNPRLLLTESELKLPIFFVLEGLLYYLKNVEIEQLFSWMNSFESNSIMIGMTYWKPEMRVNPFVLNYQLFLKNNNMKSRLSFLDYEKILKQFKGYDVMSDPEYLDLAIKYKLFPRFESNQTIFGESFLLLKKMNKE